MRTRSQFSKNLSLWAYFCDQKYRWFLTTSGWALLTLFCFALKINLPVIILISIFWWGVALTGFIIEYLRRKAFYHTLAENLQNLDRAYLVTEMINEPHFYDGAFLYDVLYQVDKSMAENVKKYQDQSREFKEFCEMWIHEVKTPLATLSVISQDPKVGEQVRRLNDQVEQVLYLARAENAEHDYLLGAVNLNEMVGNVANRNREILLNKKIDFIANPQELNHAVHTDAKWCEFIINQIINNSIKYGSTVIHVTAEDNGKEIILTIKDNGIGINEKDLPRIYEKSFTGSNGRTGNKSTGMGLYIVKTLCDKLGHRIVTTSQPEKFTKTSISFAKHEYYTAVQ